MIELLRMNVTVGMKPLLKPTSDIAISCLKRVRKHK